MSSSIDSHFIRAIEGKNIKYPPLWLLGQANTNYSFCQKIIKDCNLEDLYKNSNLSSKLTSAPVEKFGFDAAQLFTNNIFILEGIGYSVKYNPTLHIQPKANFIKTDNANFLDFQAETIVSTKKMLGSTPIVGVVEGLATLYNTISSRPYLKPEHKTLSLFIEDIVYIYIANILLQVYAGVDAILISDHQSLNKVEYYSQYQYIINKIRETTQIPIIFHSNLEWHKKLDNISCIGINTDFNLTNSMQENFGYRAVQGNFNQSYFTLSHKKFPIKVNEYFDYVYSKTTSGERSFWINCCGLNISQNASEENIRYFIKKNRELY